MDLNFAHLDASFKKQGYEKTNKLIYNSQFEFLESLRVGQMINEDSYMELKIRELQRMVHSDSHALQVLNQMLEKHDTSFTEQ
jgi:hypothetical protein